MNPSLLALVAAIYAYVAFGYFDAGRTGMGLAFTAYAISNVGFIIDTLQ